MMSHRTGEAEDEEEVIDEEMVDPMGKEGEKDGGDSEEGDQVTETDLARSEEGKQPIFHHEIYDRLVNLMSRQGAYGIFLPTHLLERMSLPYYSLRAARPWYRFHGHHLFPPRPAGLERRSSSQSPNTHLMVRTPQISPNLHHRLSALQRATDPRLRCESHQSLPESAPHNLLCDQRFPTRDVDPTGYLPPAY